MNRPSSALPLFLLAALAAIVCIGDAGALQHESVLVSEVFDGDTIVVQRGERAVTVRLIGVDTPETGRAGSIAQFFGPEAANFTLRTLRGRRVQLEFEPPDRPGGREDRYGRLLAYIITGDGGNFNLDLVRRGYARVFTKYPFTYQREFQQAQKNAKQNGIGIWDRERQAAWRDPAQRGRIIGNIRSQIYHLPGQYGYDRVAERNRIYFPSEDEARQAGFRKARN